MKQQDLDQLLKEKYTSPFRLGYDVFKDTVMPIAFNDYQKAIEDLEIKEDDVLVSTFPKSGTTWTLEMVWLIMNDLDYKRAKIPLDVRCPFIEVGAMVDVNNLMKLYNNKRHALEALLNPIGAVNRAQGRRCLKTHLPWNLLPLQIQNRIKKPKIIHVLRNPKDVCVSFHHHTRSIEALRGTLEDSYRLFIGDKLHYCPYWNNILSFWERRHLPNILIITYEDMKKDLGSVIRKVSGFLDKEFTDTQIAVLEKHLSFEEMKKNDAVNFLPTLKFLKEIVGENYYSGGAFMRSGTVGSYKEDLTPDMIDKLDKWIEENTTGTGLNF